MVRKLLVASRTSGMSIAEYLKCPKILLNLIFEHCLDFFGHNICTQRIGALKNGIGVDFHVVINGLNECRSFHFNAL